MIHISLDIRVYLNYTMVVCVFSTLHRVSLDHGYCIGKKTKANIICLKLQLLVIKSFYEFLIVFL